MGMALDASDAILPTATRNLGLMYSVKAGTSIQTGLTNAANNSGGKVFVQAGNYTITTSLLISSNTTLECESGAIISANGTSWTGTFNSAIVNANHGSYTAVPGPVVDHDITIRGCAIVATGAFQSSHPVLFGIDLRNVQNAVIDQVNCHGTSDCTAMLHDTNYVVQNSNDGTVAIGQLHANTTIDNLDTTALVQVGDLVYGPCIPAANTVASIVSSSSVTLATNATCSSASQTLSGNTHTNRTIDGLSWSTAPVVGEFVNGPGIPYNDSIMAVGSTSVTVAEPTTATASGISIVFAATRVAFGSAHNVCYDQWEGSKNFTIRDNSCASQLYGVLIDGDNTFDTAAYISGPATFTGNTIYMSGTTTQAGFWPGAPNFANSGTQGITFTSNAVIGDSVSNFTCWKVSGAGTGNLISGNKCSYSGTASHGAIITSDTGGYPGDVGLIGNYYDNVQSADYIIGLGAPNARSMNENIAGPSGTYTYSAFTNSTNNLVALLKDDNNVGYDIAGTAPVVVDSNQFANFKNVQGLSEILHVNDELLFGVSGNPFYFDIPTSTSTQPIVIGRGEAKTSGGGSIFQVQNNSTDQTSLFNVITKGSSTGTNEVQLQSALNITNGTAYATMGWLTGSGVYQCIILGAATDQSSGISGTNYTVCSNGGDTIINAPSGHNIDFDIGGGGVASLNGGALSLGAASGSAGVIIAGQVPAPSGSCAINNQVGGNTAGSFKANGACASGTVVLALTTATNGWACDAKDMTTPTDLLNQTAYTTASVTFTGSMASADQVVFECTGF